MTLTINGKQSEYESDLNLEQLLNLLGYRGAFFAVAINMHVIPRMKFAQTQIQAGDRIEILSPMQGG